MQIIGIQTPHYAPNYGAQLQAFALGLAIKDIGYPIEYINRRPAFDGIFKNCIAEFLHTIELKTRLKGFLAFEKQYLQPQTKALFTNEDYSKLETNRYKAIVVGSDQIWRDDYFYSSFEYSPYLYYVPNGETKKIAYAASFGKDSCNHPLKRQNKITGFMKDFHAISVRENSGVNILKETFGINNGVWVADPTLLHTGQSYIDYFNLSYKQPQNLVTYLLGRDDGKMKKVKAISEDLNVNKVDIYKSDSFRFVNHRIRVFLNRFKSVPSVFAWLDLILNAKYVLTDSFHGMVFCILFHKQFVVLNNEKGGTERYISLLGKIGLEDRLLAWNTDNKTIQHKMLEPIDYISADIKLNEFRLFSKNFLIDALK